MGVVSTHHNDETDTGIYDRVEMCGAGKGASANCYHAFNFFGLASHCRAMEVSVSTISVNKIPIVSPVRWNPDCTQFQSPTLLFVMLLTRPLLNLA